VTIEILPRAREDLVAGFHFYEEQEPGLGSYFRESLFADVELLRATAGVHRQEHGYHRCVSKKFPFAIYYAVSEELVQIHAVFDCRRDPYAIARILRTR
jgi:plasmid stabilization system protein ParE